MVVHKYDNIVNPLSFRRLKRIFYGIDIYWKRLTYYVHKDFFFGTTPFEPPTLKYYLSVVLL